MFKRTLVAYDGSEGAQAALRIGIDLAKRAGTALSSISIEEHLPRYAVSVTEVDEAKEQIDAHFRALAQQARDRAALEGVDLETVVEQGHEVQRILAFAREGRFDLLMLGSHGHSRIFQRIVGSTALSLARLAPCSIFIVRTARAASGRLEDVKRILVGVDGSPLGRLAFRTAVDLAILCGARLVGVTVREVSPLAGPEGAEPAYVRQLKAAALEHARSAGVAFEHVTRRGHAAQALRDYAREVQADLIVLGATGLEHPWSVTVGGTATGVASEASCSVLLVRSPRAALHVRGVMARAVSSVTVDTGLAEIVELLLRRDVKAVPVLDARRHVIGIITGGDLLERGDLDLRLSINLELDAETLGERLHALRQSRKLARDVMTHHVHTIDVEADVSSAIRLMASHRVKRLPVVDREGELVGILTRADVLRALAALPEPAPHEAHELPSVGRTVGDAATTDVPVVSEETPAEDVLVQVLENPLRRVVVVDGAGKVLGLVSDRDVLARAGADTRPWLVRMLRGQRTAPPTPLQISGQPLTAADLMAPSLITVRPEESLAHAIRLMMQHRVKRLIVVDADGRFRGLIDRREILRLLAG
jgi:nucleotide-binding universal stress UspA family protein/CBS domain containing-hemolysin-like protein